MRDLSSYTTKDMSEAETNLLLYRCPVQEIVRVDKSSTQFMFLFESISVRDENLKFHYRSYLNEENDSYVFQTPFFTLNPIYIREAVIGWRITVPPLSVSHNELYISVRHGSYKPAATSGLRRTKDGIPLLSKRFINELEEPKITLIQNSLVAYEIPGKAGILVATSLSDSRI